MPTRIAFLALAVAALAACSTTPAPPGATLGSTDVGLAAQPDGHLGDVDGGADTAGAAADAGSPACIPAACDDGNPCTSDNCAGDKPCEHVALEGTACGEPRCTGLTFQATGTCHAGVCKPGATAKCDDDNGCTLDTCSPAGCGNQPLNGTVCGQGLCDGLTHHAAAACQAGKCLPGVMIACSDNDPCTLDGCSANTGCTHLASGGPCNDGDECTTGEHCKGGKCGGGKAITCDDGNPCTVDACVAGQGCSHVLASDACDDGNPCTSGDACSGGACQPGKLTSCDDGNPCTIDSCQPVGGCLHIATNKTCDDGNACTNDTCVKGVCVHGPITEPCIAAACVGGVFQAGGTCQGGMCFSQSGVSCDDLNPCTNDGCSAKGCTHVANAGPCEDGDTCTAGDMCKAGVCKSGTAKACSDGNPCTTEVCKNGACGSVPVADGVACDDGLECTAGDVCNVGQCKGKSSTLAEILYGGAAEDRAGAIAALQDGFVLAGLTASQGAGDSDALLVRTDMDGKSLWQKTFGGKSDDRAFAAVAAGTGIAWTGFTVSQGAGNADAWLMRIDGNGEKVWEKVFGGEQFDATYGLTALTDGGLALAGFTYSYGAGLSDAWLLRTDANGKLLWSKTFGGVGEDGAYAVVALPDNGLALAGVTDPGNGFHDAWLLRTDATGKLLWSQAFGGLGNDDASALVALPDGFALAGYTTVAAGTPTSHKDAWLVRTDIGGKQLWAQAFGGKGDDIAHALAALPGGGFALAGATSSVGAGGSDAWLVRTDAVGKSLTQQTFDGGLDDVALGVVSTGGGVVLAGARSKTVVDVDAWWARVPATCQ